jgi:RNA polymerase sigma-70 factor (sigma-E family)
VSSSAWTVALEPAVVMEPQGDAEVTSGFDARFTALFDLCYRVAYRVLGHRDDAVDVAQEALARAERRWSRLADRPEPWLAKVTYNLALGVWRKQHRRSLFPQSAVEDSGVDRRAVERLDLVTALGRLPRRQREVVVLRYLADQSEDTVAAVLGCSVGTVKTHASRGLQSLRQEIGAES